MARIFISYRREDSADISGRIYDRIVSTFGRRNVFKDTSSLRGGEDFALRLEAAITPQSIVLVIISPKWMDTIKQREGEPNDYARLEVERALDQHATVIPILTKETSALSASQLPASIADLARLHALKVRDDPDFAGDINFLIRTMKTYGPQPRINRAALLIPFLLLLVLGGIVERAGLVRFSLAGIAHGTTMAQSAVRCDSPFGPTGDPTRDYVPAQTPGIEGKTIRIAGSGSPEAGFGNARINFDQVNTTTTTICRESEGEGIRDLTNGSADVAALDFALGVDSRTEKYANQFTDHRLAILPEVVIVSAPVYALLHDLTRQQIRSIFTGEYTNWNQVNGPDKPIEVIQQIAGPSDPVGVSGITTTFEKTVLNGAVIRAQSSVTNNEDAITGVADDADVGSAKYAISYVTYPSLIYYHEHTMKPNVLDKLVFIITIDGFGVTVNDGKLDPTDIQQGQYHFWDFIHAYTLKTLNQDTGQAKAVNALLNDMQGIGFQTHDMSNLDWFPPTGISPGDITCRETFNLCS